MVIRKCGFTVLVRKNWLCGYDEKCDFVGLVENWILISKKCFFGFGGFSRKCDYTILVGKCKYYNLAENEILAKKNVILLFWQKKM